MFSTIETGIIALQQQALGTTTSQATLYIPLQSTTSSADNAERFDLQEGMLQFLNLTQNVERRNKKRDEKNDDVPATTATSSIPQSLLFHQHL